MSRVLVLDAAPGGGSETNLTAPTVGIFAAHLAKGELVSAGQVVGTIEVLGVKHVLQVPRGASGRVERCAGDGRSRVPVEFGESLLTIIVAGDVGVSEPEPHDKPASASALTFVAPMSGRFYQRPSPNEAPFVVAGDTVRRGQTIGLLEVMKTFNRIVYQGDDLPAEATVDSIVPGEGDDVVRGDVILTLQANDGS